MVMNAKKLSAVRWKESPKTNLYILSSLIFDKILEKEN